MKRYVNVSFSNVIDSFFYNSGMAVSIKTIDEP